ncbi:hypothetical protein HMN09_00231900 [Mycena chlorophos]|uniref:Uncharacterized protein n=1 Tax=Mycena chlorophos TaxID=658473 RepID=A0A8H6WJ93_MYCCL|nr:hypothetical protein HMN09_00231900 [Mycena chlorophos]
MGSCSAPCRSPARVMIFHALFFAWSCSAVLVNITFDDTNSTAFTWAGQWSAITPQTPCPGCFAQPNASLAFNQSWHDGSLVSGTFSFQGVAVYIFGIDVLDPANISFAMNNPSISSFHYVNTNGGYIYNSLFFVAQSLDGTVPHTVTWSLERSSIGGGAALFDYAVVTVDQEVVSTSSSASSTSLSAGSQTSSGASSTPSSASGVGDAHTNNTAAIAGGVVGGLVALAALALIFLWCMKRRNRTQALDDGDAMEDKDPEPMAGMIIEPFSGPGSLATTPAPPSSVVPSSGSTYSPTVPPEPRRSKANVLEWTGANDSASAVQAAPAAPEPDVEERLRNLEAIVGNQAPPAYA